MHIVATGGSHLGLYRLETQVTSDNGALKTSGLGSNSAAREAIKVGFDYLKANANHVSSRLAITITTSTLSNSTTPDQPQQ
jgi:ATP-dependent Lon protease